EARRGDVQRRRQLVIGPAEVPGPQKADVPDVLCLPVERLSRHGRPSQLGDRIPPGVTEEGHGSAGTLRTLGGYGGPFEAPHLNNRPGVAIGAPFTRESAGLSQPPRPRDERVALLLVQQLRERGGWPLFH